MRKNSDLSSERVNLSMSPLPSRFELSWLIDLGARGVRRADLASIWLAVPGAWVRLWLASLRALISSLSLTFSSSRRLTWEAFCFRVSSSVVRFSSLLWVYASKSTSWIS